MKPTRHYSSRHAGLTSRGENPPEGELTMLEMQRSRTCRLASLRRETATFMRVKGIW